MSRTDFMLLDICQKTLAYKMPGQLQDSDQELKGETQQFQTKQHGIILVGLRCP